MLLLNKSLKRSERRELALTLGASLNPVVLHKPLSPSNYLRFRFKIVQNQNKRIAIS